MSEIRRGSAAIQEAAEASGGGGNFLPYIPSIYWKDDGEEHYVLLLNEMEDIPLFDMVGFIPTDSGFFQEAVAKTDPAIGERHDQFEDEWDATIRRTNVAIAVELEPKIAIVNKRRKPQGFEVKTVEYERTILDEDGDATEDKEEVTAPLIGYIAQSPTNFFNILANYDANEEPITSTAIKIVRIGKDTGTTYSLTGYPGQEIDLTNLVEYVEGISYLKDEMDDVLAGIEDIDAQEAALFLGTVFLEKREAELLDPERYDDLFSGVTESMDIFGNKKKKGKGKKAKANARPSQKRARNTEPEDDPDEEPTDPEATEPVEEKPARKAKTKAKASAKAKASSKEAPSGDRMSELRKRAEAKAAAKVKAAA